jgi:predicted ATPase
LPLSIVPALLRQPAPKIVSLQFLPHDGQGLAAFIADLKLRWDDEFTLLNEMVPAVVPTVDRVLIDSTTDANAYSVELMTRQKRKIPAQFISDGTLYTIAVLTGLLNKRGQGGVVCIDDIDQGLHPKAQRELVRQLRLLVKRQPGLQIVCTTHSPYLLDEVEADEVRCLSLGDDGFTRIACLADHPDYAAWKDEMGTGEFWSMVGESWTAKVTP